MTYKKIVNVLNRQKYNKPPFWFMRQAGRYLPEYKIIRNTSNNFLNMCYSSKKAVEVTLQPLTRWNPDGAILFSDILVIPDALGQDVQFQTGKGPILTPINSLKGLEKLNFHNLDKHLEPIYETIRQLKTRIPKKTTLIGFAGAPWTVAVYMTEGKSSKDWSEARKWMYKKPDEFKKLIDLLVIATSDYLINQIKSGVDVIQIFDSWAGILTDQEFYKWVIQPTCEIIENIRGFNSSIPIIGFPRDAGVLYLDFVKNTTVNGIGLDQSVPLDWAAQTLQPLATIQGNLDNYLLLSGGKKLTDRVTEIVQKFSNGPFIFNLGHGVLPDTPLKNVQAVVDILKNKG